MRQAVIQPHLVRVGTVLARENIRVSIEAWDGSVQGAAEVAFSNKIPSAAILSIFGVVFPN